VRGRVGFGCLRVVLNPAGEEALVEVASCSRRRAQARDLGFLEVVDGRRLTGGDCLAGRGANAAGVFGREGEAVAAERRLAGDGVDGRHLAPALARVVEAEQAPCLGALVAGQLLPRLAHGFEAADDLVEEDRLQLFAGVGRLDLLAALPFGLEAVELGLDDGAEGGRVEHRAHDLRCRRRVATGVGVGDGDRRLDLRQWAVADALLTLELWLRADAHRHWPPEAACASLAWHGPTLARVSRLMAFAWAARSAKSPSAADRLRQPLLSERAAASVSLRAL
jgi:hypothetical protein